MILFSQYFFVAVDYDNTMYAYIDRPQWNSTIRRWEARPVAYLGRLKEDEADIPEELGDMTYTSEPREVFLGGRVTQVKIPSNIKE